MTTTLLDLERDHALLDLAVRAAIRGHGHVEPNPMVGCVISSNSGTVIATEHHRVHGGAHAEILALERAGDAARGATMHVTLEPCDHMGRTGPCTDAVIGAGLSRVVIGHRDPNPEATGGIERLRAAGLEVDLVDHAGSRRLLEAFLIRHSQRRPWVLAKWAQTLDGHLATRTGHSQWISSPPSRAMVHRERGRVDAILTGIGTVLADDPRLTARTRHQRRVARRVVIDPMLKLPDDAQLLQTINEAPVTIACLDTAPEERRARLRQHGADIIALPECDGGLDVRRLLESLLEKYDVMTVLVEAGPGVLSRLADAGCIDAAAVFIAPTLLGDDQATPVLRHRTPRTIADGVNLRVRQVHRRKDDLVVLYGFDGVSDSP
jgi:diaminohydroxyphosphoribosylaminopyrimidine deaminase/5-amino-6-(5-phosphoribosylamino)uracil reductase